MPLRRAQPKPDAAPAKFPRAKRQPRHSEWTRTKMVEFLRELAATQSVSAAAKAVGMSRTSAYNLRNRLQGTPFALGWEVALEMGMHQLAHALMDRALNGVEVQRYYHGELVATTRRYDNRLAQWVLENPWRMGRAQLSREYTGMAFDNLLERIEADRLQWNEDEPLPGPDWPRLDGKEAQKAEREFAKTSWYAHDVGEKRRG